MDAHARFTEEIDKPQARGHARGTGDSLGYFRASEFAGQPVPERQWLVERFIPAGQPTMLSGDAALARAPSECSSVCLPRSTGHGWGCR